MCYKHFSAILLWLPFHCCYCCVILVRLTHRRLLCWWWWSVKTKIEAEEEVEVPLIIDHNRWLTLIASFCSYLVYSSFMPINSFIRTFLVVNFLLVLLYWKIFVNDVDEEVARGTSRGFLPNSRVNPRASKQKKLLVGMEVNHFHWLFLITRFSSLSFIVSFFLIHAHAKATDRAVKISSI